MSDELPQEPQAEEQIEEEEIDYDAPLPPICRNIRTESMFVAGMLEPTPDMGLEESGHCWCVITADVFGPDKRLVGRRECSPKRTCHEGLS